MSKKTIWGVAALILLIIGTFVFLTIRNQLELRKYQSELEKAKERLAEQNKPTEQGNEQELDTSHPDFHVHEDGTPHIGTHDDDEPKVEWSAPEGAVTKPDFPKVDPNEDPVKAAYKRLEYIKNNPYAWGGVHSERATELIAELMPGSVPIKLIDHDHGEEVGELIAELCLQNDPRAAEALIALRCDTGIYMVNMYDALEAIGPPAVPYILPYLEREETYGSDRIYINSSVFDSLARIGVRYRDDLGGIVDHIIIPKLKVIAADEDNERYSPGAVKDAREALDRLQ